MVNQKLPNEPLTYSDTIRIMKSPVVTSSKEVLGGTPVFSGTRVPIQTLIDFLKAGDSIDDFLEGFPTVTREQVLEFLEVAEQQMEKIAA